jgi:hypothetical protein
MDQLLSVYAKQLVHHTVYILHSCVDSFLLFRATSCQSRANCRVGSTWKSGQAVNLKVIVMEKCVTVVQMGRLAILNVTRMTGVARNSKAKKLALHWKRGFLAKSIVSLSTGRMNVICRISQSGVTNGSERRHCSITSFAMSTHLSGSNSRWWTRDGQRQARNRQMCLKINAGPGCLNHRVLGN